MKILTAVAGYLILIASAGFIGDASRDWLGSRDGNLLLVAAGLCLAGIAYAIWATYEFPGRARLILFLAVLLSSVGVLCSFAASRVLSRRGTFFLAQATESTSRTSG